VYARTTTLIASPSAIDEGIAYVRGEVWPRIQELEGCLGMSLVVDRESGRGIATASWDTQEALRTSASTAMALRDQATQIFGATSRPVVEEWEIASMHRMHTTHPGTCIRTAWSRVSPANVDRALEFYRSELLPHMDQLEGFASASLLIDRPAGRSVLSVAYDTREAMERTRDQADYLRAKTTQEVDVEFLDVAEFELAMAHLRIPELA
jgi:hypothetical protein